MVAKIADSLQDLNITDSLNGNLYSDTIYPNLVNRDDEKEWKVKVLVEKDSMTFKVNTEI